MHDQLPNTQFSICCEPGALWLGTDKGLYRLDTRTRAVREYETLGYATAMLDQRVFAIHRTAKGELFVGTTVGLLHYDRRKEAFDPIEGFEGVFVTGMDEDERQRLWVSTYANGLICYDLQRGEITANHIGTEDDPGPLNMLFSVFAGPGGDTSGPRASTEDSGVSTPPPDASRAMTPAAATCCPRTSSSRCSKITPEPYG